MVKHFGRPSKDVTRANNWSHALDHLCSGSLGMGGWWIDDPTGILTTGGYDASRPDKPPPYTRADCWWLQLDLRVQDFPEDLGLRDVKGAKGVSGAVARPISYCRKATIKPPMQLATNSVLRSGHWHTLC